MDNDTLYPGRPYPRGANWDGSGTNFSLFSENAVKVELLLYDDPRGSKPVRTIVMPEKSGSTWHCYLPAIGPGHHYAYRVHGPFDPERGHRFNPRKVLIDPYARALSGDVDWDDALFGYTVGHPDEDLSQDERDSGAFIPRSIVVDQSFDWEGDTHPRTPWNETVIYEAHVRGLTMLHPDVEPSLRGTYAAIGSEPIIKHLTSLGITAIELLPVQQHVNDRHLQQRGLNNYWGYNTIGFFAPDLRYASSPQGGSQVPEFKQMVKALHSAGIEVIMDVVYNHTAEGNHLGATLCFKGIDNRSYYSLSPKARRYYMDFSGCGGCFNMGHPRVLQFVMDSLRYWAVDMHVDGFRFDLAATLAREFYEVDRLSTFFDVICQDPVLSQVKLIAEPWDLGPGGYQVGNFPELWSEWNGKYRDTIRRFWKGDDGQVSEFGYRLSGSSDLYKPSNRNPHASINFITCHDGFTLRDLVSYSDKHNEENGEENRDGSDHNDSWNCGVEGETDDAAIRQLRVRQMKNMLATLLLSQGTPMLFAGDEIGSSKQGNNNTYCQNNERSWIPWEQAGSEGEELQAFVRLVLALRREHPLFRRRSFFKGRKVAGRGVRDIRWYKPDGKEMRVKEWSSCFVKSLGVLLSGDAIPDLDARGQRITDDSFLLLFNAHWEEMVFAPPTPPGTPWKTVFDTSSPGNGTPQDHTEVGTPYRLGPRSFALLVSAQKREG